MKAEKKTNKEYWKPTEIDIENLFLSYFYDSKVLIPYNKTEIVGTHDRSVLLPHFLHTNLLSWSNKRCVQLAVLCLCVHWSMCASVYASSQSRPLTKTYCETP